jgi:hypothetical protein
MTERVLTDNNGRKYITTEPDTKSKWVGLTKAEAIQLLGAGELGDSWELIKRVEKKLKDKNK